LAAEVSKGKFTSSISHELRSPLHGTLASSELLLETDLDNFQRGLLGTMHSCSRTLLDTINHILAFRELNPASDAGQSAARKETRGTAALGMVEYVDLVELIEDAVEAAYAGQGFEPPGGECKEPTDKNRAVSVIIDFDPELTDSKFSVFPEALRRLVLNLCVNAFKYTSRGWVAVRLEVKEQVRAGMEKRGAKLR
jgi:signal transduction histidine kinase